MKQKSFLFGSLLLCVMAFSTTGCSIGGDDKENEIVDDPLKDKTEYYIVGQVSDSKGVVANTKVETGSISTTTDSKGVYKLTVNDATTYKVKFTASGLQTFEAEAVIASTAKNRSQVTLNVRLAKEIVYDESEAKTVNPTDGVEVTAPNIADTSADPATVIIPANTVEETTEVAAVVYEEAQATTNETKAPVSNIAVRTEPADATAKEDVTIAVKNLADNATDGYFDTQYMSALRKDEAATRAEQNLSQPVFNSETNKYEITIPAGQKIAGKYEMNIEFERSSKTSGTVEYNAVNGKSEVLKLENREFNALTGVKLNVTVKNGWSYVTSPANALAAKGASSKLAAVIEKYIELLEGKEGVYETVTELTTNISGNHVLYYGNKANILEKTYTFHVMVGGQSTPIEVKLNSYNGYTEEYTNGAISQHSGGSTGN
ncbi:carboxypeptidase-like regulatory domain-containing protein [Bacteroides gallinarum]|uniref:carboxypeptidase-like regulatory domain-containing protein n=2 Tax=Bacteroides gallinarum TaxID=376806 RepID=UPI0003A79D99|nr:carboxypeptidase-like regulatory domain-containing protein [Bacteroides gallinarum]